MEHFLENTPRGERVESFVDVLDQDPAIDAGWYEFHVTDPKTGKKSTVQARSTYEYEKRNGQWKIVSHHSSALPSAGRCARTIRPRARPAAQRSRRHPSPAA